MSSFVNRGAELAVLDAALNRARTAEGPIVVTIEGPCGIGKSALLEAFLNRTGGRSRRLDRLAGGTVESELLDGIRIAGIDDAQWCNSETALSVERAIHDGQLRLLVLAFDDTPPTLRVPIAERIVLESLSDDSIEAIVRECAPALTDSTIRAIARCAAGSPYEATRLASLGSEPGSAARAIARFVAALPLHTRALAQMVALIGAPVEISFARAISSNPAALDTSLDQLAPILRRGASTIEFDHALTLSSVVETIPMKIPLHRRIIAAIDRAGVDSLRERMMLVEQLLGSGERVPARAAALDLAFESSRLNSQSALLWASTKHVELGEPPDERFVAFYAQFFAALMYEREFERAEAIASHALSEAQRRELDGVISLAAQLIQAQRAVERPDAARASYERYASAFTKPEERALLRAALDEDGNPAAVVTVKRGDSYFEMPNHGGDASDRTACTPRSGQSTNDTVDRTG